MKVVNVPLAVALAAGLVCAAAEYHRRRALQRTLARERAASRLTAGCLHRDLDAFRARVSVLVARQGAVHGVLDEADLVLDEALATHQARPFGGDFDDVEGGPE
ncbi:hypothetical protein [Streptomyces caniscabiei]|uniref:Secreted protein n=1 Tax=Streptomyces caniscabiei TaxID=2746961 RepID=A0ABU4MZ49_9ACTN|nr:hypothetical protein [Streptomyces caniscabiei]MBE4790315.1 hypothetical protein [Streptomyces caniscabiei]MBE4799456.1 hypothetical protein [Streptomyces caniscabiei]MDX3015172.1 hypothetical protein [Streptomyces caniscabiei]MDX3042615.1 hypothetical protein [Streptomyces caniscabiei]